MGNENVTSINRAEASTTTNGAIFEMLPPQIKASIMGQFIESNTLNHTAEQFMKALEDRLLTTAVTSTFNALKEIVTNTKNTAQ